MPISKTIEVNNTGVQATYWVLDRFTPHLNEGITDCKLNGYLSSAAFAGGKGSLTDRSYSAPTPGSFATLTGTQIIAAIQTFILSQPEFTGGSIVA